ncbi:1-4-dihydroxy-2-naphthoyl-CoA thioesterase 1 [Nymphaea thermarum]|nr:1-4-dihydroxy-2-naphthoyl-CoA thioesterase 1 [Nymphaea thermarum]
MAEKPESKTAELDLALHTMGFEIDLVSRERVSGRLKVEETCCQPFKVMHGGVSALIAEALASIGAHLSSGFQRVAGVQLSINHLKPANLGDLVEAEATPLNKGNRVQVWTVQLWKVDPLTQERSVLISTSTVTLLISLPIPENARDAATKLKKYAKL